MNYQHINDDNEAMENFWKSIDLTSHTYNSFTPPQDIVHTFPPQPFDDIDDPWNPDQEYFHQDKYRDKFHSCIDYVYEFFVLLKDILTYKLFSF